MVAAGYFLWSFSWHLLSSSSPLSLVGSNPPAGAGGRTSTCRAGSLRGSCSSFLSFSPYVIPGGDARKVTHERRRFPWRLVRAISFVQASETIFVRFLNSPVERDTVLALYRMQCKDISTRRRQNCACALSGFWCSCCRHWFPLFCRQRRRPL